MSRAQMHTTHQVNFVFLNLFDAINPVTMRNERAVFPPVSTKVTMLLIDRSSPYPRFEGELVPRAGVFVKIYFILRN